MARRGFLHYPDRRLQTPAAPVAGITDEIRAIWAEMVETMDAMPGYGLAAPQIGVMLRLAVVDCSTERGQAVLLADPEILSASAETRDHEEASPNLPGISAVVARPRAVVVRFLNAEGESEERGFEDLWATSVQHQIDHLDGRLFIDRLTPLKRRMMLRRVVKLSRGRTRA